MITVNDIFSLFNHFCELQNYLQIEENLQEELQRQWSIKKEQGWLRFGKTNDEIEIFKTRHASVKQLSL